MSNSILTPTAVTREALRVLHQKLAFIGSINRTYDSSFAQSGAKIGDSLKIRLPNQYTVRTGATLSAQDTSEQSTTLTVATQKGVDMTFSSAELTMSLDDFSKRVLEPAMAVLAASMEADALSMYKDVYNLVDGDTAAIAMSHIMLGRRVLNENLAPMDNNRTALLSTLHNAKLVDALKGLFQDSSAIREQYREGMMGRTGGFDFYESSHIGRHTTGDAAKTTTVSINGAVTANGTAQATVTNGSSKTFKVGDVFTVANCFRVHPETKVSTGELQQFVVTEDAASTTIKFAPAIYTSGPYQNVTAAGMPNSSALVKIGAGASETLDNSMVYHRDAFAFATADLTMPKGVDFSAREQYDGISMRIVRQYDINSDRLPCRIDVLYGFKAIRPQLACRIHADG